jgi:CBS domain containing-hemolysin-like protein
MNPATVMGICLGLVILATFILSVFHMSLEFYSKIALSRLLEAKDKTYRAKVLGLYDDIRIAVDFVRVVMLIAVLLFLFLLFPKSRQWPLGFFGIFLAVYLVFFEGLPRIIDGLTRHKLVSSFLPSYRILVLLASPLLLLSRAIDRKKDVEEEGLREASDEEIETFIDEAKEEGIIEKDEDRLLRSVVEFGDILVREIMTPRVNMVCIREDATIGKIIELVNIEQYSRIPVFKDRIDNIEGIVIAMDLLKFTEKEHQGDPLRPLVRPVHFVPESMKVAQLLKELQRRKEKMAIVVDEHGGVSGLATIEDLVEEIVGEIQDEYDTEEPLVSKNGPSDYTVSGEVRVEEVEDLFDSDLAEDDFITMSGFITHHLGHLPQKGETLEVKGFTLEIQEVDQKRILKLRIRRNKKNADKDEG